MTKKRSAKYTFVASMISMVLCLTMLIGTSLAWFTDIASNNGNIIAIGELDVELRMGTETGDGQYDYVDISKEGSTTKIFSEESDGKWEPGKTKVAFLQVANVGDLALNYNIILNVLAKDADGNAVTDLATAMEYAIIPETDKTTYDAAMAALATGENPLTGWNAVTALATETGHIMAGSTLAAQNGALDEVAAGQEDSDSFVLAVHMDEDAGNAWQNKAITIDVTVSAKQMASENDYFGNTYDANAEFYREPVDGGMLKNGSAEEGGTSWDKADVVAGYVSDELAHGGSNAFKLVPAGEDVTKLYQTISVEAGKTYKVSGYVYTDKTDQRQMIKIDQYAKNILENNTSVTVVPMVEAGNWLYVEKEFTTIGEGKIMVCFRGPKQFGSIYWDDLSFVEVTE